jgi:DNA-directed RNA polymerase subunit RPC12/RpoP
MTQETLGFVKLEWTCPKCGSRNPGPEKTCLSCGAPQPENVQFEQASGQQISQDESLRQVAETGPDIHCPYCGTRNPATAAICSQCGGDLKGAASREVGRVMGAYQAKAPAQVACPRCGAQNPETNLKCANCGAPLTLPAASPAAARPAIPAKLGWPVIAAMVVLLVCLCGGGIWIFGKAFTSKDVTGVVEAVQWQTRVEVQALGPVQHTGWRDEIPSGVQIGDCQNQVRRSVDSQPSSGDYNKVCGTPYTKDTGTGIGKVVQDCRFEVLEPYCEYTVDEWKTLHNVENQGNDFAPIFASPRLENNQRLGGKQSSLVVVFDTNQGQYEYSVNNLQEFQRFLVGSQWILNINGFGQVVGVEPAR